MNISFNEKFALVNMLKYVNLSTNSKLHHMSKIQYKESLSTVGECLDYLHVPEIESHILFVTF